MFGLGCQIMRQRRSSLFLLILSAGQARSPPCQRTTASRLSPGRVAAQEIPRGRQDRQSPSNSGGLHIES